MRSQGHEPGPRARRITVELESRSRPRFVTRSARFPMPPLIRSTCLPVRTQKLQVRDDVVDVVVCQRDETAQGPRTNRVLRLREVEEPLIVSDGVAERLGAVVVEVGRGVRDAPERRDLEQLRKEGAGNDGRWRWAAGGVGSRSSPRSGERIVTTGLIPSLMTHVRIGLLGSLTIVTPVLMKRTPGGLPPAKSECAWLTMFSIGPP